MKSNCSFLLSTVFVILINSFSGNRVISQNQNTDNSLTNGSVRRVTDGINATQQIFRLVVSNGTNSDELVVLFNLNASDGVDDYDSPKFFNSNVAVPEIYTIVGTEKMVINGLHSLDNNDSIPMGFYTGTAGTFTLRASEMTNFGSTIKMILKDKLLNTEKDMTDGSSYTFTSGVTTTESRFAIVMRILAVAPSASAATNVSSESFTANWTSVSGASNYRLDVATNNDFSTLVAGYSDLQVSGTSKAVNGLLPKTNYYYRVRAVGPNNTSSNSGTITVTTSSVININASVNSSGLPDCPVCDILVKKGGVFIVDNPRRNKNITLEAGAKLTNVAGNTLDADSVILKSDVSGSATFVENGTTNATVASVQQYLTAGRNWYISSPVSNATISALSSATSVVSYNESTASWIPETGLLAPLKGYISTATKTDGVITMNGTLNTGNMSVDLSRTTGQTKAGFNLVGNPYPSYLDWEAVTKTNISGTMWYRTKGTGAYVFDTYNQTGSVGTNNNGNGAVTRYIPPMQAFWVRVEGGVAGKLSMTNAMRSHGMGANLLKSPASNQAIQPLIRLQVSNGLNSDETVVYFNSNASNGYDAYDSPKMTNANTLVPEIYTLAGNEQLVINGLNTDALNKVVPLGFVPGQANTFTIKISEMSNFGNDDRIALRDNLLNTEQILYAGSSYTFNSDATTTDSRFSLIFKSPTAQTGITKPADNNSIVIYSGGAGQIIVQTDLQNINGKITVYNSVGQKMLNIFTTGAVTEIQSFLPGAYLIAVELNGFKTIRKVLVE